MCIGAQVTVAGDQGKVISKVVTVRRVWGWVLLPLDMDVVRYVIYGNLNTASYRDEVLTTDILPCLERTGPQAVLQDDNARPYRATLALASTYTALI